MTKAQTPTQIRTATRIEEKAALNQSQRLALAALASNKENRSIAAGDVADVVTKTLAGHYQQKPEAAQIVIRAACLLEAAIFDPIFSGFNGHRDQLQSLFAALEDPYAAVLTSMAERAGKLRAIGLTPAQTALMVGADTKIRKAANAAGAAKVRKACLAFITKYGQAAP